MRQQLAGNHIDFIQLRIFFTVYFYIDAHTVHQRRNGKILEYIALHHMAPVTG